MRIRYLLIALLAIAAPAQAQLYKWVDKNGVLNYTDTPPADAKQNAVERLSDRVSSYEVDPVTKAAAARPGPSFYELQLEREWAQRQRLRAAAEQMPYYDDPRFAGYATPYGPAVVYARPVRPAAFRPLTRPFRPNRPLVR
jgi:hypothetical protein